jgi:hypothetical protein
VARTQKSEAAWFGRPLGPKILLQQDMPTRGFIVIQACRLNVTERRKKRPNPQDLAKWLGRCGHHVAMRRWREGYCTVPKDGAPKPGQEQTEPMCE